MSCSPTAPKAVTVAPAASFAPSALVAWESEFRIILPRKVGLNFWLTFSCPARECALAHKCKGVFIDSFKVDNVQACISKCVEADQTDVRDI